VFDGSGATRSVTQQAFTIGQTEVPNNPKFWLRFATSVGGSGATFVCITQKIEGVRSFAGKKITISLWAKSTTSINVFGTLQQVFGTGGSPSSVVQTNMPTQSISTSWQRYSWTIDLPSVSGKTIGTNNDDYLNVLIALPVNVIFTFDLAQVQVEEGQRATPFEVRPYPVELQLCMRYYEVGHSYVETNYNATSPSVFTTFSVVKRATPSISLYDDSNGGFSVTNFNRQTHFGFAPYVQGSVYMETGWKANAEL
jgi:hypothetical protein